VRTEFLPDFTGKTLLDINLAFSCWLTDVYHTRAHSATAMTPFNRFTAQMQLLRPAPDDLTDHFRKTALRTVARDRTISLMGRVYEAPVELIGKRVSVLYHEDEPQWVEVRLAQTSYGKIRPVDLHVNAKVKRNKNREIELAEENTGHDYIGGKLWGKGGPS
jgi:hypothetical protein